MSAAPYSPGFLAYCAARDALRQRMADASARLAAIPGTGSGPMGLTPDHVKALPEWRAAHFAYWQAHTALADLNRRSVKRYRAELAQEQRARRGGWRMSIPRIDPASLSREAARALLHESLRGDDLARCAAGMAKGKARRDLQRIGQAHLRNAIALADTLHGPLPDDIAAMSPDDLLRALMA